MKLDYFTYTDYCTAFYVPEISAVMIYNEIQEKEIQTIPAGSKEEAERIIARWLKHGPRGCICEAL